ncbi:MAG: primosomal protein N' [Armatimonadota bacterium]|nr:primosomal protein N' [bacterium]
MYARVLVDTGATSPIESLTYEIPDGLMGRVTAGTCVLVPLGTRQAIGYVISLEEVSEIESTRPIIADIDSPLQITEETIDLARWISMQYLCPLPRVLAGMLPGVMHCKVQAKVILTESHDQHLTPAETRLYERIKSFDAPPTADSLTSGPDKSSIQRALRQLEVKGVARREWHLIAPSGKPRVLKGVRLSDHVMRGSYGGVRLTDKQEQLIELMRGLDREVSIVELTQKHGVSAAVITGLEKKRCLKKVDIITRRAPAFTRVMQGRVDLSDEQQQAVDEITGSMRSGGYTGHMLFGVTASGKTEVYLRCIELALESGKTSLVLLPEIALTTQVMNIFKSRFGENVAVLHSALSAGERFDEWVRIQEGEARVVLGARSAVFAPVTDLGLVIVDEEHEGSYKQDTPPRYNGRDVAIQRAKAAGAVLVLGSATPSIESFSRAKAGGYNLISMLKRIENRPMPQVFVADLREEYTKGAPTIFSGILKQGIQDRLARGEQVILFQNRRAYSTFLLCRDCGFVMRCPNCAVSLKFYASERKMACHHCDYEVAAPTACPKCHSIKIGKFGIGTERVEEEVRKAFPTARVLRMDRDTTARKGSHGSILATFRAGEADILVGTQMIAKGLDFPNVTLVGIISADTSINLPDFRAAERTYQLASQVAGRSGRGTRPGEVVIQTFDPEQYAIKYAVNHDYVGFYNTELEMRRELNYPPFGSLVNIVSRDADERQAKERLDTLVTGLKLARMVDRMGVEIKGPFPAVLAKLRGEFRWHVVLRSSDREKMLSLLGACFDHNPTLRRSLTVDVDPVSML